MKIQKMTAIFLCVAAVFYSGCGSGRKEKNEISTNISINDNERNKPEKSPELTAKATLTPAEQITPTSMYMPKPTENTAPVTQSTENKSTAKTAGMTNVIPTSKVTTEANATPTAKTTMTPSKTAAKTPHVRTSTPSSTITTTPVPTKTSETPTKPPEMPTKVPETPTKPTETPTKAPEFDINYWVDFAKQYAVSIGLKLDKTAIYNWDNPIRASAQCQYLERDIKDSLNWYAADNTIDRVWIWFENVEDENYNIYIGYA